MINHLRKWHPRHFRFAPQGRPNRIEGKTALYPYIQEILNDVEFRSILQQQIYLTQDPDIIVVEITIEGHIISTEGPYNGKYVWIMRMKDGKLIHQRDYWSPLALLKIKGGLDASKQNIKVSE
jgi:uncharacterized protein